MGIDLKKYQRPYDGENLHPIGINKNKKEAKPSVFQFGKQLALIDNDHKLYGISNEVLQLYDLQKDTAEQNDLSSLQPTKLEALHRRYQAWYLSVQNSNTGADY